MIKFIKNKKIIFLLIIFFGFFGVAGNSLAAIDLSSGHWETTFDCDTDGNPSNGDTDWLQYSDPLVCDGLSKSGSWTTSDGHYEQIISAANNPIGGGGKGQRHWIGNGTNNNSGDLKIVFNTSPGKFWLRWYMRWESGFGKFGQYKVIYGFSGTDNGPLMNYFYPSDGMSFEYLATGNGNVACSNCGWGVQFYPTGVSDGSWVLNEVMVDAAGGTLKWWVNEQLVIDQTDVQFKQPYVSYLLIGGNQKVVANGRSMYIDYDDIAISTNGYIGPLEFSDTTPPSYPTGLSVS